MRVTIEAPAKINLFLRVTGRRDDGYHLLSSLFQMVDLCDTLTITPAPPGKIEFLADSSEIPVNDENLVCRAAQALQKRYGVAKGASIFLAKEIPVSAGLGGGSSDAAAALVGLNLLWELGAAREELADLAAPLGSDIPFFFNGPTAWVTGAGEKVSPVRLSTPFSLLLVKPSYGVSAAEAYQAGDFVFDPTTFDEGVMNDLLSGDPARMAPHMVNDLSPGVMGLYPELARLKEKIASTNPLVVMLCGSGSTLLALYATDSKLSSAQRILQDEVQFVRQVTARTTAPGPLCD